MVGVTCKTVHRSATKILGGLIKTAMGTQQKLHRYQDQDNVSILTTRKTTTCTGHRLGLPVVQLGYSIPTSTPGTRMVDGARAQGEPTLS